MKFRRDFVTNSSSSSYICEICGRKEVGYEMGLTDADMYECENGHIFCVEEALEASPEQLMAYILENGYNKAEYNDGEEYSEEELNLMDEESLISIAAEDDNFGIPECMCPICNFIEFSKKDMKMYLMKKYSVPEEEAFAAVKAKNKRRKKLYDQEYIEYVSKKEGQDTADILNNWKGTFRTYHEFKQYIGR